MSEQLQADIREPLVTALNKFHIDSLCDFIFDCEATTHVIDQQPLLGCGGDDALATAIQQTFYKRCYSLNVGASISSAFEPTFGNVQFAELLAAANRGIEFWDKGWIIDQLGPEGQVFVHKGDRKRVGVPGHFISNDPPGAALRIHGSVSIRVPHGTFESQDGYYCAFGETLDESADQLSLTRIYFNCLANNAVILLEELSAALNRFQTPFQFKTPAAPSLYGRVDAAVLYVSSRYFPITARIVARIREKVTLEAPHPLFTKRLWPGIGAAADPGSGESFGSHRCRLVAEGIVDAWREGTQTASARVAAISARFRGEGLDLSRPWLGPNGVDIFDIPQAADHS